MRWGVGADRLLRKPSAPFGKLPFARESSPRPPQRGVPPAPSLAQPRTISPTWINRQRRHGSPSAWPMPVFPPTGWWNKACLDKRKPERTYRRSIARSKRIWDRGQLWQAAPKLVSGGQRDRMRAGRPRSQGNHSPLEGESQKPSRQRRRLMRWGGTPTTSRPYLRRKALRPLGNSRLRPDESSPRRKLAHDGADQDRE